jgi:hypothetical protein
MQIEPIKLKVGDDDWEIEFDESLIGNECWLEIRYKALRYTFHFTNLDHLKRDCKALAGARNTNSFRFGQEKIWLNTYKFYIETSGPLNIEIPIPKYLQSKLSKRFCEPEKPKVPELEVGDIALFAWGSFQASYKRQTQYIGNGTFFDVFENSRTTVQDQFVRGRKLAKVYRLGVKIWEAGE